MKWKGGWGRGGRVEKRMKVESWSAFPKWSACEALATLTAAATASQCCQCDAAYGRGGIDAPLGQFLAMWPDFPCLIAAKSTLLRTDHHLWGVSKNGTTGGRVDVLGGGERCAAREVVRHYRSLVVWPVVVLSEEFLFRNKDFRFYELIFIFIFGSRYRGSVQPAGP